MIALPSGSAGSVLYTGPTRFVGRLTLAFDGTGQVRVSVQGVLVAVEARDARTLAPRPVPSNMKPALADTNDLRIEVEGSVIVTGGTTAAGILPEAGGSDLPVWVDPKTGLAIPMPPHETVERIDTTIPRSTRIYRETIPPRAPDLVVRWRGTALTMSIVALTNVTAGGLRAV